MGGSLKFKGEPKKKRKHREHDAGDLGVGTSTLEPEKEEQGWISLPTPRAAHGPLFLVHKLTASCLSINPALNNRLQTHELDSASQTALLEPENPAHVWVAIRLPESERSYTLRSAAGRFLACDEHGFVSADREARGMQEEFEFIDTADEELFGIKSVAYDTYLGIEEVAGGKLEIRGDSKEPSEHEAWHVRMQARNRNELAKREMADKNKAGVDDGLTIIKDYKSTEDDFIKKYQAPLKGKNGSFATSAEEARYLKKAKNEGRLHEEMLDRRMKLKSDRYC